MYKNIDIDKLHGDEPYLDSWNPACKQKKSEDFFYDWEMETKKYEESQNNTLKNESIKTKEEIDENLKIVKEKTQRMLDELNAAVARMFNYIG